MASTSVITYNQVIDRIETILNANPLVKTITKGDIWEVDNKEIVYPQVHIVTEGVDFSTYELKYRFRLFIMDLVELVSGDYLDIWTYHECGGTESLYSGQMYIYLDVQKVS